MMTQWQAVLLSRPKTMRLLVLFVLLALANTAWAGKPKKEKEVEPYSVGTYILGMKLEDLKKVPAPKEAKLSCSHDKKKPKGVGKKWLKLDKVMKATKISRCNYFVEVDGEFHPSSFYVGTPLEYWLDFIEDKDGEYRLLQVPISFKDGQAKQAIDFVMGKYGPPKGDSYNWDNGASKIFIASDDGKEGIILLTHNKLHELSVERMGDTSNNEDHE